MKNLIVLFALLGTVSAQASTPAHTEYDAVIQELRLDPVNAGINPSAFAYELEADVMLGSNPCQAEGTTVELVEVVKDRVLEITILKKIPNLEARICTREYRPVVQTLRTEIRGFRGEIDAIVVKNVEEEGLDISLALD